MGRADGKEAELPEVKKLREMNGFYAVMPRKGCGVARLGL
jgi:hypothetical protein